MSENTLPSAHPSAPLPLRFERTTAVAADGIGGLIASFAAASKAGSAASNSGEFVLEGGECARTQPAAASATIRVHVVVNKDDVLSRSTVPFALRKSRWELEGVAESVQERIANIWAFLNIHIDALLTRPIWLDERIDIAHARLADIEHGYRGWLRANITRLRPSHTTAVTRLAPLPAEAALFATRPTSDPFLYMSDLNKTAPISTRPTPTQFAQIAALENRMLRMERDAPLWFALNMAFRGRPAFLKEPLEVLVERLGSRWVARIDCAFV